MKLLIISVIFAALFAAKILAAPQEPPVEVKVSERNDHPDGGYDWKYELSDGTKRSEEGTIVGVGTENQSIAITGSFEYPAPDGTKISLTYSADQDGFKADGAHLPKAPEDPNA